jgi:hypothetical protein
MCVMESERDRKEKRKIEREIEKKKIEKRERETYARERPVCFCSRT